MHIGYIIKFDAQIRDITLGVSNEIIHYCATTVALPKAHVVFLTIFPDQEKTEGLCNEGCY